MRVWKGLVAAALLLGAGSITANGLRGRSAPPIDVQLATVKKVSITRVVSGAGKVQSSTTVKISSNLSGDLTELLVKEGDPVKKGQVLGRIDRRRFEAAAKQARAAESAARSEITIAQVEVDRTRRELGRAKGLFEKGLASSAEIDKVRADFDGASGRLGSARERHTQAVGSHEEALNNLSKTTLVSPIDGSVIQLSREVGERVRGSDFSEDVVMILAALSTMEVKIEVGEHEVVFLKPGQKADILVDALEGQTFAGTVTEIAQNALIKNPGTEAEVTSFPVKVALNTRPPGTLPGMTAEVRIAAQMHPEAITVPIQSVTVRAEKNLPDSKSPIEGSSTTLVAKKRGDTLAKVIFVVGPDSRVHVRRVRTGISSESEMEILEGVQEDEKIVDGPYRTLAKDLKDGDLVKEAEPGKARFSSGRS